MEKILSHLQPLKAAPNSLSRYFKGDNLTTTIFTSNFYQRKALHVSVLSYTPILCLGFFNEQPPQHQCVKFVFICRKEPTVLQGQMLLPTSKGCCTVYYSEDVIRAEEQGIFLKE